MIKRYLQTQVEQDLARKMVLLGGPRQVGKTTLALQVLKNAQGYLSWDVAEHRERILRRELPPTPLVVFDELHKWRSWRGYLKGLWDTPGRNTKILVTGSARLDMFRRGGDSLQGRYHYLRLYPLSVAELGAESPSLLEDLLRLGGFPEPFLGGSEVQARRWSREYRSRLVQEDVATLERVSDLGTLELLSIRLPELVGSPLSVNALREDLQVSHKTVDGWLRILERLAAIFRLAPFGSPRLRAARKAQKHYHLDWALVPEDGPRFENLMAVHLIKWVHFQQDSLGRDLELRYFRDLDGREVDFVVTEGHKRPVLAVEAKLSDEEVSKSLVYFKRKFPACQAWQVTARGKKDYQTVDGIRVCPALRLLADLV